MGGTEKGNCHVYCFFNLTNMAGASLTDPEKFHNADPDFIKDANPDQEC